MLKPQKNQIQNRNEDDDDEKFQIQKDEGDEGKVCSVAATVRCKLITMQRLSNVQFIQNLYRYLLIKFEYRRLDGRGRLLRWEDANLHFDDIKLCPIHSVNITISSSLT